MAKWKNGWYVLQNPQKYIGEKTKVNYKSNLEERVMFWLDNNLKVLKWAYENVAIDYPKPVFMNGRLHHIETHKYFLDFYVELLENDQSIGKYIIEVKSKSATRPPIKPKKITKKSQERYMQECATYVVNSNKWSAAKKFADTNGIKFKMLLDSDIL
jgi:hypothetical protein